MSLNELVNSTNSNPQDIYVKSSNVYNAIDTYGYSMVSGTGGPAAERTLTLVDPLANANVVLSTNGTVTQITNITTTVILNQASGIITTVSSTLAAVTDAAFTVTNSRCLATSMIQVSLVNYGGTMVTNGIPVVSVGAVANGSFVIHVTNVHASNALGGVMKIAFLVA